MQQSTAALLLLAKHTGTGENSTRALNAEPLATNTENEQRASTRQHWSTLSRAGQQLSVDRRNLRVSQRLFGRDASIELLSAACQSH